MGDADVVERIPGHRDYVGEISGLQLADLPLPHKNFSAFQHVRLQYGERLHSVTHHKHQFARLRTVGERPNVGTDGQRNTRSNLLFELLNMVIEGFVLGLFPRDPGRVPRNTRRP